MTKTYQIALCLSLLLHVFLLLFWEDREDKITREEIPVQLLFRAPQERDLTSSLSHDSTQEVESQELLSEDFSLPTEFTQNIPGELSVKELFPDSHVEFSPVGADLYFPQDQVVFETVEEAPQPSSGPVVEGGARLLWEPEMDWKSLSGENLSDISFSAVITIDESGFVSHIDLTTQGVTSVENKIRHYLNNLVFQPSTEVETLSVIFNFKVGVISIHEE